MIDLADTVDLIRDTNGNAVAQSNGETSPRKVPQPFKIPASVIDLDSTEAKNYQENNIPIDTPCVTDSEDVDSDNEKNCDESSEMSGAANGL